MQITRKFLITTPKSPEGFVYSYNQIGLFAGVEILEQSLTEMQRVTFINLLHVEINSFLTWASDYIKKNGGEVIELMDNISFQMMWDLYNDKLRSSKKKSEDKWKKMQIADRVKAYYFFPKYNRHRGEAEKKYLETYLNAELWNN